MTRPARRERSAPPASGGHARSRLVARAELLGSGVAFGLMAVLARRLSRGAGGFTAGQLSVVRFVAGAAVTGAYFLARPSAWRPVNHRLLVTRGISGGLVVVLYFLARPAAWRPVNHRLLVTRGISGGLVVVLYFWALARIPAGEAGMIYNLFPAIATAMAVFTLGERPTAHLLAGLALATVGVVLVLGGGGLRLGLGWGELSALAAAVFAATSANVIRRMRGTETAPTIFFFFCVAGLPVVAPFALDPWPAASAAWGTAAAMALCALAAQVLMSDAYGALSVGEAAVWLQLTPLAQVALAVPLLGEPVSAAAVSGVCVGIAGVAWATLKGSRPATTA